MDLSELPSQPFRRHPWEAARFRFAWDVLRSAGLDRSPATVLDAGAGDGWFGTRLLARMAAGAEITCWDVGYSADDLARLSATAPPGMRFTASRPGSTFDALLLLDVLEHVENDRNFLDPLVAENLRPGALVLVSVPAWKGLFGRHDLALGHLRRYQPAECAGLLRRAGLEIVEHGGLFHSLALARVAATVMQRVRGGATPQAHRLEWQHGALAGRLVEGALALDNRMSLRLARAGIEVPGLSWWARCRKPS
jgi:SAM-dependent methyltransferase